MNGRVEVTRKNLRTITYSLMVHAIVLEAYIIFALMYTTDHIFPVLPIKYVINKESDPNTSFKLATCMNLQYQIYACYFVHVLHRKLLQILGQRR